MVTIIDENGEKEKYRTDLFFLHLREEKNNEDFADELMKTFNETGNFVEKGIWAD